MVLALLNYASRGTVREYYMSEPRSGVHLVVARMFFNQSLTVYGGVMDAFNQLNNHTEFRNPYVVSRATNNYSIKIGISYNFNATQSKYKGQNASEEERSRM